MVDNDRDSTIHMEDPSTYINNSYKAIVRSDSNELISIVKDSYKLVRNQELIDSLFRELATLSYAFKIDSRHSFVENAQMRLQIIFPELLLHDSESDIAFGISLFNSYDQSLGVRCEFSGLRKICENGLILQSMLSRFYKKHTSGFSFEGFGESLEEAKTFFPDIQERINRLEHLRVTEELVEQVSDKISKRLAEKVIEDNEIFRLSQWDLLNRITNHISHQIEPRLQNNYQQAVSKLFAI